MRRESNSAPESGHDHFGLGAKIRISVTLTQLVSGFLTVVFTIAIISVNHHNYYGQFYSLSAYIGTGIWVGFFFILNAAFGLHAANLQYGGLKSQGFTLTTLVMNSINILFATMLMCMSGYSAYGTNTPCTDYRMKEKCVSRNAMLALDTLLMLIGLAQLTMAGISIRYAKAALNPSEVHINAVGGEAHNSDDGYSSRYQKIIQIITIIQLLMSVACIAFGIASTVTSGSDDTDRTGAALWCGVFFFIISAYHACAVSKGRIQTTVVAASVLIMILLSLTLIILSAMSLSVTNKPCKPGYKAHGVCKKINALFALDLLSLLIGLAQLGFMATYITIAVRMMLSYNRDSTSMIGICEIVALSFIAMESRAKQVVPSLVLESQNSNHQPATGSQLMQQQTAYGQTGSSSGDRQFISSHTQHVEQNQDAHLPPEYDSLATKQTSESDFRKVPDAPPPLYETLNL